MTLNLAVISLASLFLFSKLEKCFAGRGPTEKTEKGEPLSLASAWNYFRNSPQLWFLGVQCGQSTWPTA